MNSHVTRHLYLVKFIKIMVHDTSQLGQVLYLIVNFRICIGVDKISKE